MGLKHNVDKEFSNSQVLVCHENVVDIIPVLPATIDASRWRHDDDKRRHKLLSRIQFDFNIDSICEYLIYLQDITNR